MEKRVLMVATVSSMIGQFNMNNIKILLNLGYLVDVAVNFKDTNVWPLERIQMFKEQLSNMGIECIQLDFSRNPLKLFAHRKTYKQVLAMLKNRHYFFIHTHTPIASAIVRIAARKTKTKVIYTAHGFHFYKGAPLINWLLYYPLEKKLSKYTDVLITINKEDYEIACKKFKAKKNVYVPGVGVDLKRFSPNEDRRLKIREELGLKEDAVVLLSVGELNKNKNHISVIKAIEGMDFVYVIVGKGPLDKELTAFAKEKKVDLRLMGYRNDVPSFYNAADIYILPSIREGLNVSLMEAMASCLPVACGKIRGNVDLIDDKEVLFNPTSIVEIKNAIVMSIQNKKSLGLKNLSKIQHFDLSTVENLSSDVYKTI